MGLGRLWLGVEGSCIPEILHWSISGEYTAMGMVAVHDSLPNDDLLWFTRWTSIRILPQTSQEIGYQAIRDMLLMPGAQRMQVTYLL